MRRAFAFAVLFAACPVAEGVAASCSSGAFQSQLDCYGNDISSAPSPDAADCCQQCAAVVACSWWTHDQYDSHGTHTPTCFLKSGCDDKRSNPNAVSGAAAPAPPAPPTPPTPPPTPPPPSSYRSHYDGNNPLRIAPDAARRSNNYFLIIGDWGRSGGPTSGDCMDGVAAMMKAYAAKQAAAGKTLLFIAAVGDNFYWTGVDPATSWTTQWAQPYGTNDPSSPLYKVPWLAVHGNHDLGDGDPHAFCPDVAPKANIEGQNYAGQQLNADRNPTRPADGSTAHYWLPDFNYHYEIPELSLEVIAIDTNANDVGGLGGDASGHAAAFAGCGGQDKVQAWLDMVSSGGEDLLRARAANGTATSTVIIQHYPGQCKRGVFEGALPGGRRTQTLCAFGHTHDQQCVAANGPNGTCSDVLTGGGGGCCGPAVNLAGFTAVALNDDGGFSVDVTSPDVRMGNGQCRW